MPQTTSSSRLTDIFQRFESEILDLWMRHQLAAMQSGGMGRVEEQTLRGEAARFLGLLRQAMGRGEFDIAESHWDDVKAMLSELSRSRAVKGFTPAETAMFIFSLKHPVFQLPSAHH